ncbi:serine/threonine-protein kinase [Undibacterium crateris]|uniref:serine/threonine-protein kinase n=1 Tax=Undibacterium crateris TaxID=2528175 RepID=UPI001389C59B|nr:serine/threonine-protein kinase [Undibacterium crateris]NDI86451.1 protein kinase [Undibacterium crateris]
MQNQPTVTNSIENDAAAAAELPPQRYYKHYQIEGQLGEGGFGHVFQAWDPKLCRHVAIKQLKIDSQESGPATTNLLKEARLAASLNHAAFVQIFAIEDDVSPAAIVMELVQGKTLKQLMQQGPVSASRALEWLVQVAAAMLVAHQAGLVHGDLKPSNLMVEAAGRVRILDFGLASQEDAQATGSVSYANPQGTIAYMAPERLLGRAADALADVYALGVMLYEAVAGHRPFPELQGLALAAAHMQSNSDSWSFPPQLEQSVVQLIVSMTARQPERRPAGMADVLQRMQYLLEHTDASGVVAAKPVADAVPVAAPAQLISGQSRILTASWRRYASIFAVVAVLGLGAWKAYPYLEDRLSLLKPYSETLNMQQGIQAVQLFDRPGSLDKAAKNFETILRHNPENAAAVAGMSLVYSFRYSGDEKDELWLSKADASAQHALKLNAQLAIAHAANGLLQLNKWRINEALEIFDKALALDAKNCFAWYGKFDTLILLGRLNEARDLALEARKRFPNDRLFADSLGTAYYTAGDLASAEQAFRDSIRLQPDAVNAYANLSATLSDQGRTEDALHILQQGLQIRSSGRLNTALGVALFQKADYLGAASAFEQAVAPDKGNPANYVYWANLADTLLWIPGRQPEARNAYLKAKELLIPQLQRAPDDVVLVYRMGLYAARLGEKEDAVRHIRRALELAPNSAKVHFRVGMAYELLGDRQLALAEIAKAVQLGFPVKSIEAEPDLMALRRDPAYLK